MISHEVKKAINQIVRNKGHFPSLQDMCEALVCSALAARKAMEALAEDGYLEKMGTWYKFSEKKVEEIKDEISVSDKTNMRIDREISQGIKITEDVLRDRTEEINSLYEKSTELIREANERASDDLEEMNSLLKEEPQTSHNVEIIKILDKKKKGRPLGSKTRKNRIQEFLTAHETPKVEKEIAENVTLYGVPVYIIQLCMGVIGVGAAIISTYYTTVWLIEFLPWAFALLLSAIMVGFSVSAFETVILFISGQVTKSKITKIIIATGFIVLWIIVSFFSIASTVAGQYNKHVLNLREQAKQGISTGKASWGLLQERKIDLQRRLSEHRHQITTLNGIMAGMSDIKARNDNSQTWAETQYRLQQANATMSKTEDELSKVRDEEQRQLDNSRKTGVLLSSAASTDIPDFYGWLSGIMGLARDKIQFMMSLFPAIFVDIIAPIGIALALFLRQKYKKIVES